ncbi:MAG: transketolase C-terminal domain-containing protein [Anaerolineae bacterium]
MPPDITLVRFISGLAKRRCQTLRHAGARFEIGKSIPLRTGTDVTFIAIGEPAQALEAAEQLTGEGISAGVISMHTLKPFDTEALLHVAATSRAIVTVEEHSVYGGLGERCASLLMEHRVSLPFKIVGFPDEYTISGSQTEIFAHYGISREGLSRIARNLLQAEQVG